MPKETGVDFYTIGVAHVPVPFVHGFVDCGHCTRCFQRRGFETYGCDLMDRIVICKEDLDKRHPECPVEIQDTPF